MAASDGEHTVAPTPRSPPKYPDFCGRRRMQLEVQILNREVGFLEQEELQSLEGLQPVSRCCKEVHEFVGTNQDPLVPLNKKRRSSCRFWRWLGSKLCICFSCICCCTGCCHRCKKPSCSCCPNWKHLCCCNCHCDCLRCCYPDVSCCQLPRSCCCWKTSCCCKLPCSCCSWKTSRCCKLPCSCCSWKTSCCCKLPCSCCSWKTSCCCKLPHSCCCKLPGCCSWNPCCCKPPKCCWCRETSCCKMPKCCCSPTISCPEYSCGCVFDCPKCNGVHLCPKCSKPCCVTGCLC